MRPPVRRGQRVRRASVLALVPVQRETVPHPNLTKCGCTVRHLGFLTEFCFGDDRSTVASGKGRVSQCALVCAKEVTWTLSSFLSVALMVSPTVEPQPQPPSSLTSLSPCSVYRAATDPTAASPGGTASGGRKERPWPRSERHGARTRSDLLRGLLRLRVPHQEVDYEKRRRSRPAQILPRNPAQDQR